MKSTFLLLLVALMYSATTQARDTAHHFSIQEALESPAFEGRLDSNVKLYFGIKKPANIVKNHGEFLSNRKTNAFGKSDQRACEWALLSALLALQDRATLEGGNAVAGIHSFYRREAYTSDSLYECHSGAIMAGVTLQGTVVSVD
ncbi:excinuclease ATPase subunit [Porticoccaceae bacterium]|nr:excinuclease ATPase subunit [Porticoccaceae bacterium]